MATQRKSRRLGAPKYFRTEEQSQWHGRNHRPRPLLVDDIEETTSNGTRRAVAFVPPNSDTLVRVQLNKNATTEQAILEWMARRVIGGTDPTPGVDIRPFAPLLFFGAFSTTGTPCSDVLHFQPVRFAEPGILSEAMEVWFQSGRRGPNPMDVFAFLSPGVHLPLGVNDTPQDIRQRTWAYVAIDLGRPLGAQLAELQEYFGNLQTWSHQLAKRPVPRPAKRDTVRDVLIFALRFSQGATVPSIAKRVFPRERKDSAEIKVKQIIRRLRSLMTTLAVERDAGGGRPKVPG